MGKKISFDTTVGDDIPVTVIGSYDRPDPSVGYYGSFEVESVYISYDLLANDISSLLTKKQFDDLDYEGVQAATTQAYEEKEAAAESRYQRERNDNLREDL